MIIKSCVVLMLDVGKPETELSFFNVRRRGTMLASFLLLFICQWVNPENRSQH